jgi:crotonobetainyl-CoA:carnitine CoA-transferase CaiB-like acyl-CoA transferase
MIDLALYQAPFRYMDEMVPAFAHNGTVRVRMGAETHNLVPHGHFQTKDDRWLAITCSSDKMFERLAAMIGDPKLLDPFYLTIANRLKKRDIVTAVVVNWVASLEASEVRAICDTHEVPCSPLLSVADIFDDPHYQARGDLLSMQDDINGAVVVPARPAAHERHAALNAPPALGLYVPAAQLEHDGAPPVLYLPASHALQDASAPAATVLP